MIHAVVHPPDVQDHDGGVLALSTMFGLYPFLAKVFADGGYQGTKFRDAMKQVPPDLSVDIVKRSDTAKRFEVLPRRWVVVCMQSCRRALTGADVRLGQIYDIMP